MKKEKRIKKIDKPIPVLRDDLSPELERLMYAFNDYVDKHKGCCNAIIAVCAYDEKKDSEIIDDHVFIWGAKDTTALWLDCLKEDLDKGQFDELCWDC